MRRRFYDEDHEAFRSAVREFVEREVVPYQQGWEEAGHIDPALWVAAGAGCEPQDVSGLVKQFDAMAAMVKQMSQMSILDRVRTLSGLGKAGAFNPGALLKAPKQSTGKRLTPKEREKQKKLREKEARRIARELRDKRKGGPNP